MSQLAGHFPRVSFDVLFHVGSFDPACKKTGSYEGAGLSVSLHPEEWSYIAKLGGNPTWSLRRTNNLFLSAHAISHKGKHLVMDWAIACGLAEACDVWRWRYFDEELESFVTSQFASYEEALEESRGLTDDDEPVGTIRKLSEHRSTPLLDQLAMQARPTIGNDLTLDLLYPIYADEVLGLDGVWWNDILDPSCYSAPRGVISLRSLPSWQRCLAALDPLLSDDFYEAA